MSRGFTYVGLLILLAGLGLSALGALRLGQSMLRRSTEEQLIVQGKLWIAALESYADATPAGQSPLPRNAAELLRDERQRPFKRHLRTIPFDPVTSSQDWVLIRANDGSNGILGVHSQSTAQPIKLQGFERGLDYFEEQKSYQEWKFMGPRR